MKKDTAKVFLIIWLVSIALFISLLYLSAVNSSLTILGVLILVVVSIGILSFLAMFIFLILGKQTATQEDITTTTKSRKFWKSPIFYTVLFLIILAITTFLVGKVIGNFPNESDNVKPVIKCNREFPYNIAPEFERARSLRLQRMIDAGYDMQMDYYNCTNIVYNDLSGIGIDGISRFDEKSDIQDLRIYVDKGYESSDDTLTSILLAREFSRLSLFVESINDGYELDCFQKETVALSDELFYIWTLNSEEKQAIFSKIEVFQNGGYTDPRLNQELTIISDLLDVGDKSYESCKIKYEMDTSDFDECRVNTVAELVSEMVQNKEYYQNLCK